mgnify:CR=1 FL=1
MTNNQHLEGPTQRTRRENREEDTSTEDKDKGQGQTLRTKERRRREERDQNRSPENRDKGQGQEESDRGLPTKRTRVEHKGSHEFAKVS